MKELLFNISATLTSKATTNLVENTMTYPLGVIEQVLEKINTELSK